MTSPRSSMTGWSPVWRSMIDSRRYPSAQRPEVATAPWSGPRCTIVAFMRATRSGSGASLARSPQIPHMRSGEGYAVVSCHVERPLEDFVWKRYRELVASRPSGFEIASLLRPPDDGEETVRFV